MATNAIKPQPVETEKKKRHRSPNYPTVGLREAVDRLKKFMKEDGRAGATPEIAARHIGFATAHGLAYSVLSALKKFDLVADKDGRVVPTQRAIEITSLPETDERRARAIREAALLPQIYAELIEQYRATGLPSDETLEGELKAYKGFNPNAVKEFIKAFRETLEFAGLTDFSVLGSESQDGNGKKEPQIGDYVQWEHNGILGLAQPRKVTSFSEDGEYAFVEGYTTGLPVDQIIPADPPDLLQSPIIAPIQGKSKGMAKAYGTLTAMRQEVFSLTEGEVVLNWPSPLSETSIQDLQDWLELVKRKISRSTSPKSENPTP